MPDPKQSLCYALDVAGAEEAKDHVKRLAPHVGIFKVGLQLFIREGPGLIRSIHDLGAEKIFLDLKLFDIPRTVAQARISVSKLPVEFVTVHCEALAQPGALGKEEHPGALPRVLAVTILTSLSGMQLRELGYRRNLSLRDVVLLRADIARGSGCAGVVCSGMEVESVRNRLGRDLLLVTPGIRPSWTEVAGDDQHRTCTAREAIRAGADILVVGRPIRKAADPVDAARRILEEIEQGYKDRYR